MIELTSPLSREECILRLRENMAPLGTIFSKHEVIGEVTDDMRLIARKRHTLFGRRGSLQHIRVDLLEKEKSTALRYQFITRRGIFIYLVACILGGSWMIHSQTDEQGIPLAVILLIGFLIAAFGILLGSMNVLI